MYLSFYGLQKEPFHTTPDPYFLFLSPSHKEALGAIIYGIEKKKGFVAILGEVGVGKTTILRAYLEGKHQNKHKTIYIFNPVLTYQELLKSMLRGLDLVPTHSDLSEMIDQLHKALITEYRSNSTVVVVIDEAQNIPIETLENLRMLSNLETSTDKLIQFILIGQPELEALLNQPRLRQLQQRIAIQATITTLTLRESQDYIKHRIARASTGKPQVFSNGAIQFICKHAQGVPRRINMICDNSLSTGFGYQEKPVTTKVVKEIIGDGSTPRSFRPFKWVAAIAAITVFFLGIFIWKNNSFTENLDILPIFSDTLSSPNAQVMAQKMTAEKTGSIIEQVRDMNQGETLLEASPPQAFNDISEKALMQGYLNKTQSPREKIQKPISQDDKKSPVTLEETVPSTIFPKQPPKPLSRKHIAHAASGQQAKDKIQTAGNSMILSQSKSFHGRDSTAPTVRSVNSGESLSQITKEVYGSFDPKHLLWITQHNPEIVDPDLIHVGQKLVLPDFSKE